MSVASMQSSLSISAPHPFTRWDRTNLRYAFYEKLEDLPSFYVGKSTRVTTTKYEDYGALDKLTSQKRSYALYIFKIIENITSLTFTAATDPTESEIGLGAVNINTSAWSTLGSTDFISSYAAQAGDVWFATQAREATGIDHPNTPNGRSDFFYNTLPHELGHALGLSHTHSGDESTPTSGLSASENTSKFSIMSYNGHPSEGAVVYDFQLYDIASLQNLYGANHTYNSSRNTYSIFHERKPIGGTRQIGGSLSGSFDRIFSIWDGGGKDEIDASAYNGGAYVDLRPGYFSSIGPKALESNSATGFVAGIINNDYTVSLNPNGQLGRENISIAFGAYIEDATGSSANDVIIGNMLSNKLWGAGRKHRAANDNYVCREATLIVKQACGRLGI